MGKIAFVYLPFVAPMMPPLSIAVLTAFLEKNNIRTKSYDLNIELYRYLLNKDVVMDGFEFIEKEYNDLYLNKKIEDHDKKGNRLLSLLLKKDYILNNLETASAKFSSNSDVRTHKQLFWTTKVISTALEVSTYGFVKLNSENPMNFSFDATYLETEKIFKDSSWEKVKLWFYNKIIDICKYNDYLCFSLCYDNQMYFMIWLSKLIKSNYPDKKIVIGGPVVSAIIKQTTLNFQHNFLEKNASLFDVAIVGDGEYPLLDYFRGISNSNVFFTPFSNIEMIGYDKRKPPLYVPNFEALPLHLYLTPQLTLPFITARHCYWGKCRFCTHSVGYSQYIKYSDIEIIMCLEQIIANLGVTNFYFVDECMAPSTAYSIANWVATHNSNVKWMTDMRFENFLMNENNVKFLAKGGCKYIAFGMESANDRVLKCMNKGITREKIAKIIDNCHASKIAVTLMFFFGFPTETIEEAKDTFHFVLEYINKIGGIGIGSFTMMPGAFVYQHYKEFGIESVDNEGNYVVNEGMSREEAYTMYQNCYAYIVKNVYRGHPFYHRTFYLLELEEQDKNEYPIGFTQYKNIVRKIKNVPNVDNIRFGEGVLYKKIFVSSENESTNKMEVNIVSDFYNITERIYFIPNDIFEQIVLLCNQSDNNLTDEYIKQLLKVGLIQYEE